MAFNTQRSLLDAALAGNLPISIADGRVPGWEQEDLFGYNSSVPIGSERAIDPANVNYYFPDSAQPLTVTAASAEDLVLLIVGRDADYNEIIEFVTLNGTTATTSQSFLRWTFSRVYSNNNTTHSNLTISHPGNVDSKTMIPANKNISQALFFTVAKDKVVYIESIGLNAGDAREVTFNFKLRQAKYPIVNGKEDYTQFQGFYPWAEFYNIPLVELSVDLDRSNNPFKLSPRSDVIITASTLSATTAVSGSATYIQRQLADSEYA